MQPKVLDLYVYFPTLVVVGPFKPLLTGFQSCEVLAWAPPVGTLHVESAGSPGQGFGANLGIDAPPKQAWKLMDDVYLSTPARAAVLPGAP